MRFDGLIPGYQVDVNVNEKKSSKNIYWDFGRIVDGEKQLDPHLHYGCYLLGYCQYDFVKEVQKEMLLYDKPEVGENFLSNEQLYLNKRSFELASKIKEMTGGFKSFYALSGSDANEGAIKLAFAYNQKKGNGKRKVILSFDGSYHGSTYLTQSLGNTLFNDDPFYDMPHYPHKKIVPRDFDLYTLDLETVACIIVETHTYAKKLKPYTYDFWKNLEKIRIMYDIPIIVDDIFMGAGKLGKFFGWETTSFRPSIFTMGKAITGGYYPLSMTCYDEHIDNTLGDDFNWDHGYTYSFYQPGIISVLYYLNKINFDKFDTIRRIVREIFEGQGFEIQANAGLIFSTKREKPFHLIAPLNATGEYYNVLNRTLTNLKESDI
jgi:acetylornithine/succinyldiaminopimelate/putrescine aminotransferase